MTITLEQPDKSKTASSSMTPVEHLTELRTRVLVSAAAFVVASTVAFLLHPWILSFLRHPYCQVAPTHCVFHITGPLDGLSLRIKIASYGGLLLASPVLHQIFNPISYISLVVLLMVVFGVTFEFPVLLV
ncbi:MAG: twin-arginine translocase subunit TatC [Acidimicrobiales bacterium]